MGDGVADVEGALEFRPFGGEVDAVDVDGQVRVEFLVQNVDEIPGAAPEFLGDNALDHNHFPLDLREEAGRVLVHFRGDVEPFGLGEEQRLLGAGDGDIHEPPLLFLAVLLVFADGAEVREDAFGKAGDEHVRELQALRLVDGHHLEGGDVLAVVVVGIEGDVLQVIRQRGFVRGADGFVELDGGEEFVQVLQPVLVLVLADGLLEAGTVQNAVQEVAHAVFQRIGLGILDEVDEGLRRRFPVAVPDLEGAEKGHAVRGGIVPERVQELLAEFPGGDVDDPFEGDVVVLVVHEPEVGQGVLDFPALEEAGAAPDGVLDPGVQEGLLQGAGLVSAAVQDGDVVDFGAVCDEEFDLRDDPVRLFLFRFPVEVDDGAALRLPGEKVLGDAVLVVGNHAVGDVQDLRGGPVVFVQDDGFVGRELHEKVRPGTAPLVDGLVRVAHDEKVPVPGRQPFHEVPVIEVTVLSLIDHDVVQVVLPPFAGLRKAVQDVLGDVHQVVEVQGVVLHLPAHVAREPGGLPHFVRNLRPREHVGGDVSVQGLVDGNRLQELLDGLLGPLEAHLVHRLLRDGLAVFLVQDGESLGEADAVDLFPEELDTETVDRAHEVVVVPAVHHPRDALPHLRGRLVRKGQAQDIGRVDAHDVHQVRIPVRQRLRLPRTGPRHDADPTLRRGHGLPLAAVQSFENVGHVVIPGLTGNLKSNGSLPRPWP